MHKPICYIIGAGDDYGLNFVPNKDDYVIAADGGFDYLLKHGIKANLVIGDFDSTKHIPRHDNIIALPIEKDDTDMFAAIKEGIKKGYDIFHIYGGTGGRIEHTLANIQLLAFLSQNKKQGFLFGEDKIITSITNNTMKFSCDAKGYLSIISHSEKSIGVYLKGLKYKLDNATLTNIFPIGMSNEFINKKSSVTVTDGTIIIILPIDAKETII